MDDSKEQNPLDRILELLPVLQTSVTTLFQYECARHNIPETEVQCIVDASEDGIVSARIEPGSVPTIRLSAAWTLDALFNGRSEVIVECLRRCAIIAHKRLRWTLSGNKPRNAMEYVERQRAFRLCNPSSFSLPVKHFRTSLTVTMSDALTGETITRENVRPSELQDVQREVAHELTAKVYAHTQVATILDMLHAQKEAAAEESPIKAVNVTMVSADYIIQSLTYEDMKL
jgi:hypothetical protein